jgi:hypothetical protein
VITAMMTGASRCAWVIAWGFVVIMLGSICRSIVGLRPGPAGRLATNAFLTLVRFVGIWRRLGRGRACRDGARSAGEASA